jgi:arylformamidase
LIKRYLSYPLTLKLPAYGSVSENMSINPINSFENGDSCRTYWIGFKNHWGTHVDCPAHFDRFGKCVQDYPCEFWEFDNPQVIEITANPGQIIIIDNLKHQIDKKTDLLLLRSGWGLKRGSDTYSRHNPGLEPKIGKWLRRAFPNVRAVGIDWVSISSFQNRQTGREAHRSFLCSDGQTSPIVLIEDLDLTEPLLGLVKVLVVPIRIEKIDSSPCTVIGFFR